MGPKTDPFDRWRGAAKDTWRYAGRIGNGRGLESPQDRDEDYYTLFIQMMKHESCGVRQMAGLSLSTHEIFGKEYYHLLDAYIDAGRDAELAEALYEAWSRCERGTDERLVMGHAYIELRRRQYLWGRPETADEIGLEKVSPPSRGWFSFSNAHRRELDERLMAQGDDQIAEVAKDLQAHVRLLESDSLQHVVWWD